jgi:hypothetical protein
MKFTPRDGNAAAELFVGIIRYNRCILHGSDYMTIRTAKGNESNGIPNGKPQFLYS